MSEHKVAFNSRCPQSESQPALHTRFFYTFNNQKPSLKSLGCSIASSEALQECCFLHGVSRPASGSRLFQEAQCCLLGSRKASLHHRQKRAFKCQQHIEGSSHPPQSTVHCLTSSLERREMVRSNFRIAPKLLRNLEKSPIFLSNRCVQDTCAHTHSQSHSFFSRKCVDGHLCSGTFMERAGQQDRKCSGLQVYF